jgi:4-hydroxy-3-methylbut-2-enyl diphosphate reductase
MRILVAQSAGLCLGVRRALELTEELAAREGPRVVTVGPLCHNRDVVTRLRARGVEVVEPGDGAPLRGRPAVVRSHGLPLEGMRALEAEGAEIHDGTCPHVRSAQTLASRMAAQGYTVLVVGERDHPEVAAVLSHAREGARTASRPVRALAAGDPRELGEALAGARKVAVLAQTTETRARFRELVNACLELDLVEVRALDTTCDDGVRRRREAAELAARADLTLVVGSPTSANTRRLAELCAARGRSVQVESAAALEDGWLDAVETVAVVAGASTPEASVAAIVERLRSLDQARRGASGAPGGQGA